MAAVTLKGLVVLPRGFNSVNQVHQQLPLPLFILGSLEAPAVATPEHTESLAKVLPQIEQVLGLPTK